MTTAVFTTVENLAVGDVLTESRWDNQISDNLNQLAGAHRNLLTNGGCEVWQRGAGGFTANNAYTTDRWQLTISTGTATVTQETSIVDTGSGSSLKIVTAGTVDQSIKQKIENLADLRGRTIYFSARVRQSVASAVVARIAAAGGSSDSATSATTGSYVTLTVSLAVGAADAGPLTVALVFSAAGTFYLDNAMCVVGPAPAPYQPLHPQEDLARCQRYYARMHGDTSAGANYFAYGAASANCSLPYPHKVTTYATPTVTKNGTWAVTNCGQPQIGFVDNYAAAIFATVTALGSFGWGTNSTDDYISIESNP